MNPDQTAPIVYIVFNDRLPTNIRRQDEQTIKIVGLYS